MQWEFVVVLILAVPVILFPAAFVWYLNLGGLYSALNQVQKRRAGRANVVDSVAEDRLSAGRAVAEDRRREEDLVGVRR